MSRIQRCVGKLIESPGQTQHLAIAFHAAHRGGRIDYQTSESNWQYLFGSASPLDVVNPVYGQPAGAMSTIIDSNQKLRQTGFYLQDQLSFGNFRAALGLRHDRAVQETRNLLTGMSSKQSDEETSYRLGLLYLFDNGFTPYASYTTSFEPVIGTQMQVVRLSDPPPQGNSSWG